MAASSVQLSASVPPENGRWKIEDTKYQVTGLQFDSGILRALSDDRKFQFSLRKALRTVLGYENTFSGADPAHRSIRIVDRSRLQHHGHAFLNDNTPPLLVSQIHRLVLAQADAMKRGMARLIRASFD